MAYICRNIDSASELKFWPGVVFSDKLEKYIDELADVHSVHPDSFALILINFVAATLEFSYVLRANISTNTIPTNLYNILVARSCKIAMTWEPLAKLIFSAYGKSDLTRLLRDMLKAVILHRPRKFKSSGHTNADQSISATLDEMSKAGLLAGLDECCRTIVCDEADMTFADVGLFLSSNGYRPATEMNCRG
jgi:hypothetical protein